MTSLDLHPEELFDKAARGAVTPEEQALLDAHLSACAACRFERRVRADFAAVEGDVGDVDDLVARALSGAATTSEAPPVSTAAAGLGRRRRVGPLLVAAASLLGVASFAAVAQYTGLLPKLLAPTPEVRPPAPPAEPRVRAPRPPPPPAVVEAPAVVPPVEEQRPAPVVEPEPAAPPRVDRGAPRPGPSTARPEAPAAPVVSPATPSEPDALGLFTRAHEARVRGDTASALRDLRAVVVRFPAAPEAALAHAELGRLLLDRGEAASALESLDAYLASPHRLLEEDVRGARALALQKLGRADEERAAWEALLGDYPTGVFAPRARARLQALSP